MPGACCKKSGKKARRHTPIVSKRQAGLFGAAYAAKKSGKSAPAYVPKSLSNESLEILGSHLKEWGGKKR